MLVTYYYWLILDPYFIHNSSMVMLSRLLVIGSDGDIKRGGLFWRHGDFVSWIPSGCNEKGIIVVCNTLAWPVYTILCIHGFMLFWGTPSTTPYSSPTPNSLLVDCCVINYYAVVQGYCPIFLFWKLFHPFLCLCPKKMYQPVPPTLPPITFYSPFSLPLFPYLPTIGWVLLLYT